MQLEFLEMQELLCIYYMLVTLIRMLSTTNEMLPEMLPAVKKLIIRHKNFSTKLSYILDMIMSKILTRVRMLPGMLPMIIT